MVLNINDGYKSPDNNPLEIVERKGLGHPDTLADMLAEKISIAYSQYCIKNFGAVLHHNLDKLNTMGGLISNIDWEKANGRSHTGY